jgi:hypothetical protein
MALLRPVVLASVAVALVAGAAGCGSGNSGPLGADSVAAIVAEAKANTIAAQSFTVSGGESSAGLSVNLTIVSGLGCTGTITQGAGNTSTLIWTGKTVYAHAKGLPANEWMKGTSSDSDLQGLLTLCRPSTILASLDASGVTSASRSVTVYDGQPALSLSLPGTADGQGGTIVVTDTATPVLLNISQPGSLSLGFSSYGAAKTITPPAA